MITGKKRGMILLWLALRQRFDTMMDGLFANGMLLWLALRQRFDTIRPLLKPCPASPCGKNGLK